MCSSDSTETQVRIGCRSLASVRVRRLPPAKHHGGGSRARLNGAWPQWCQRRALVVAKAAAGLASAAEGEPQQCAMARRPG